MIYRYTIHANGDETWSPVSGTDCYEGVVSNVGQVILEKGSGFSFADWRDKAWEQYNGIRTVIPAEENNSMYAKAAVDEAYQVIEESKRFNQAEEILNRVRAWGEDTYAAGTMFRFNKEFTRAAVTGSYSIGSGFPAKVYIYGALKLESGEWASTGRAQFGDWDEFVKFLVTEGEPVIKDDVEIFPPAVFPQVTGGVAEPGEVV